MPATGSFIQICSMIFHAYPMARKLVKTIINKIGQFPITINLHSDLIAELRVSVEKKTLKK